MGKDYLKEMISELEKGIITEKELFLHEAIEKYGHEEGMTLLNRYLDVFREKKGLKAGRFPLLFFKEENLLLTCYSIQINPFLGLELEKKKVIPDNFFDPKIKYLVTKTREARSGYIPLSIRMPLRENLLFKVPVYTAIYEVKKESSFFSSISEVVDSKNIGLSEAFVLSHFLIEKIAKKLGHTYKIDGLNHFGDKRSVDFVIQILKQKDLLEELMSESEGI
jgi:hypothetical protein